jgi:hypothetical protein
MAVRLCKIAFQMRRDKFPTGAGQPEVFIWRSKMNVFWVFVKNFGCRLYPFRKRFESD